MQKGGGGRPTYRESNVCVGRRRGCVQKREYTSCVEKEREMETGDMELNGRRGGKQHKEGSIMGDFARTKLSLSLFILTPRARPQKSFKEIP